MISVIMLTYNRDNYVANMIEDVLAQKHDDFEFVIVDNGSTDLTPGILKKYAASDKRIKIITLPKSTIGKARNEGFIKSRGEYVAYVDDDDRLVPDYLQFLWMLIHENQADISMCGATEGDGITRKPQCVFDEKMILDGEEATRLLIGRKYIRAGLPTKLYRRGILERFPCREDVKNEDIHTQYKYLLASKVVAIHGVDKYYFTRHDCNVSGFTGNPGNWDRRTMLDYLGAYKDRTEYILNNAPSLYSYAKYSEWSFMISMIEKIDHYKLDDCLELQLDMVAELKTYHDEFCQMEWIQDFEREWVHKYLEEK